MTEIKPAGDIVCFYVGSLPVYQLLFGRSTIHELQRGEQTIKRKAPIKVTREHFQRTCYAWGGARDGKELTPSGSDV